MPTDNRSNYIGAQALTGWPLGAEQDFWTQAL